MPLQSVVVSLKTGQTIKGALAEIHEDALILKAAQVASEEARGRVQWTKLDGETVIPMANVDFYQQSLDPAILG